MKLTYYSFHILSLILLVTGAMLLAYSFASMSGAHGVFGAVCLVVSIFSDMASNTVKTD